MTIDDVFEVERHDGVRLIRLNRLEALNAANPQLHRRISQVWSEIAADPEARAVDLGVFARCRMILTFAETLWMRP
jgi:enoyl-CoA hydratase